ncbi:unnamed protein product [Rhizophagus irregularis]|nr:unnamed protein product [Rhizophagus irregularis]
MAKIGSRSPPPFGASPPAFGFRVWIGRWLSLQADGSGFHYRIGGFPPLELYWMGGFPPWNFIGWAGFPPLELYWMGGFPLSIWGFPLRTLLDGRVSINELGISPFGLYWIGFPFGFYQIGFSTDFYQVR